MTAKTRRRREVWGPFESDQDVLDWLDENPELAKRAEIRQVLGGGAFVMVRTDDLEDEA